jgi:replicative DNA helicase
VVQKAKEIQSIAVNGEVSQEELLGKINKILIDLNDNSTNGNSLDLKDSILQVIKDLRDKDSMQAKLTKTGFDSLDDKLVGISPGQLIVLAARPSMGKTALALNIGQKIAEKYNEHVVVFSLEMLHSELTQRLISMESLVNSQKFKSKEFNAEDLKKIASASEKLAKLPMIIDDYSSTSLARIRTQCLRYKAKHGKVRAVIVDYLQLMTMEETKKGNKADDIGVITRGLKLLAKELECPVILLSQLNRGVEGRDNKRPMLQDLRSSGDIEQDADMVWFIYRDEVYNTDTKDKSEAEIIIAKNRGGETGTAKLRWQGEFTKFNAKAEDIF